MRKSLSAFLPKKADLRLTPAMADSSGSRYFSFSLLYFAQGVPEGLTFFGIPAWLAMNGVSPIAIGSYIAVLMLPWSTKLILAPMMDRFTIKAMGRKRPWVLFGQIGLVLSFVSLSFLSDPLNNMAWLMGIGFVISLFGCFQDVATDAMAVDVIPLDEQARASGLMWGAKVIGVSASLAAGTYTINAFGFSTGVLVPAAFTSILILVPLYFLERKGEKRFPWSNGKASTEAVLLQAESMLQILRNTFRAASRYSSLVFSAFMVLMGIALGYSGTIIPVFTIQELNWTNAEYSNLYASANLVGGVLGMLIAGVLIDFFGKKKMLFIYTVLWMLAIGGFLFYQSMWFNSTIASLVVFAIVSTETFATIASFAMGMAHCWKRISATQFTLYMSINNIGRSIGAAGAGYAKDGLNWYYTFAILLVVIALCFLFVGFIRIRRQLTAIDRLEKEALALVTVP